MSNLLPDPKETERRLRNLTPRQCQILYWVGRGLVYKEVAKLMRCGQDLIQKEMSLMYQTLGLTHLRTSDKRRLLNTHICPIHQKMVSDPETDCLDGVIEPDPPTPNPMLVEEVIEDEKKGLIPLDTALIRSAQLASNGPRQGDIRQKTMSELRPPMYSRSSPLPWILTSIFGTLLCLSLAAIIILVTQQPTTVAQKPATAVATANQSPPASTPVVVPPSPIPTYTVQLTYTPYPIQPTYTPYVVVGTRAPVILTPTIQPDDQNPPPGSIVASGQSFTRSGIQVFLDKTISIEGSNIVPYLKVVNTRSTAYLLRFVPKVFHLRDDLGTRYSFDPTKGSFKSAEDVFQATLEPNRVETVVFRTYGTGLAFLESFQGKISPQARYLIFTADDFAGMTNMNWRYDLH